MGMISVEHMDFVTVPTRDAERAKRFYGDTVGLPMERETPAGAEFRAGQVTLEVWAPESAGMDFAPNPAGFALRVPDVAAARRTLEEAGVEFLGDTLDTGVCHMALLHDPDGNLLILHRRYAAAD
jgi:catechol 2,3-dioxygenase-like lactoylglutathione lyase family enzyme